MGPLRLRLVGQLSTCAFEKRSDSTAPMSKIATAQTTPIFISSSQKSRSEVETCEQRRAL